MDFQLSMTAGDAAAMALAVVLALLALWGPRRTVTDEVVIAWQLRSKPAKKDGRRLESVRRWSATITDPHTLRLVAMNVGRRDIEIDQQFPLLNEEGSRLFSVELVGPERTVFTSARADLRRLGGGGGENPNRWDMVPFHLSVGRALVVEGFTSGRARSVEFHNLRHARYVRRTGWTRRVLAAALPLLLVVGVSFAVSQSWIQVRFSGWTVIAAAVVALAIISRICFRIRLTERVGKSWSRIWSTPLLKVPQEIPHPPEGVSLSFELICGRGLGTTGWSLLVTNHGLTTADDVHVRVVGPRRHLPVLEESAPHSIDHGCALELAFTEWPADTDLIDVEVAWREDGEERSHPETLSASYDQHAG